MTLLDTLAPLRAHGGARRTVGLDDATLARFSANADLKAAVEAAAAEYARIREEFAELLDLDEDAQVQATLANPRGQLRPGMFVQTEVVVGSAARVISVPGSAISYAPYGDSVFVVTDMKNDKGQAYRGVRQQFVKLGQARGDQVSIQSGLKPGDEVVTSGVFKLRPGAAIHINNTSTPTNNPAPKPENS